MDIKRPKCIKKVTVAENDFVRINMDILRFSDGNEGSHVKVTHQNSGGIVLILINENKEIYLHYAYHYAANVTQLEFIRGFSDANETSVESVKRELSEEILYGYRIIREPLLVGKIYPDSTILGNSAKIYLMEIEAGDKLKERKDRTEALGDGKFYSVEDFEELICKGEITDGFTLASYSLLKTNKMLTNHRELMT